MQLPAICGQQRGIDAFLDQGMRKQKIVDIRTDEVLLDEPRTDILVVVNEMAQDIE